MALTTDVNTCGNGAVTRQGLFSLKLRHRGHQITLALRQRSAYRRRRRGKNLRYRAQRFNNRSRPQGWLPPSLRHRVDTTVAWACRLQRWAPLTAVHVERVAFDVQAAGHGQPLLGVEYCYGTLHGAEVREYLLAKWDRTCAYCGATGVPLNIEHIRPRSRGGSDRISNLALACVPCNEAKAARPLEEFLHTGRVAVRSSGSFSVRTAQGLVLDTTHRRLQLLQRADGYGYTHRKEEGVRAPA
jgi:5-methylcytosine-specific restriction endonuclease McrA